VLQYLLKGRAHRRLFVLLWGRCEVGSVSALARLASASFSAVYRELESMRGAGLASCERSGPELRYRARTDHPQAALLRQLANAPDVGEARRQADHDEEVRSWLASAGAPLGASEPLAPPPTLEELLAEGVSLSHRDSTVARVLPTVLWHRRKDVDVDRLVLEATRRDERHALGYFLELAGLLGGDESLVEVSRGLRDRRRTKERMFFDGPHGRYSRALARRNTPKEARRWGYLTNMGLESFRAVFEKFAEVQ
jgi:hypothetical protein